MQLLELKRIKEQIKTRTKEVFSSWVHYSSYICGKIVEMRKILIFIFVLLTTLFIFPNSIFSANQCGIDPYNGLRTFCSVGTGNRVAVPNYTGCRTGETCVTNKNSDSVEITCQKAGSGLGIDTAIGCIPIGDTNALIGFILSWGIGIAGGIAFLLILIAGFQIMTSQGDPKRLQTGKELLTSAIAGVLLLIFSIFILRLIGFNILNIQFFK
jgi:hypothetical protein